MIFSYYTQDGNLMKDGEIMWRICDSDGKPFETPVKTYFHAESGYNGGKKNLNPYAANHLHFYNKSLAKEALKSLKYTTYPK